MQGMVPLPNNHALGYIDLYDWVLYELQWSESINNNKKNNNNNNASDWYEIEWTVSSPTGEGELLVVHAETRQYYTHLYGMPVTEDWNVYETVIRNLSIPLSSSSSSSSDGEMILPIKIQILQGGFNLQSLCIRKRQDVDHTVTETPSPAPSLSAFLPDEIPVFVSTTDSCDSIYQAARDYTQMQGMSVQGKQVSNLAYLDPSDSVVYDMIVVNDGYYQWHFGVCSPVGDGAFRVEITNKDEDEALIALAIEQLPTTNDWYTYEAVSSSELIQLKQGSYTIKVIVEQGGWNLQWWCWKLIQEAIDKTETPTPTTPTAAPTSFTGSSTTGFVRADGLRILDTNDNPLLIRGVALGGWMAPHLVASSDSISAHEWWKQMDDTVGTAQRREFQQSWLNQFVTQPDLQEMKLTGFNAIRVPLHYEYFTLPIEKETLSGYDTWLGMGFRLLDQLLEWASEYELYVLLDLQAAPGGQGLDPVTDYDSAFPSLWEHSENRRKTTALWQELARRYANHQWVAGYDLLSAVDWIFQENDWASRHWNGCDETTNGPLREFYQETIAAIRQVDTNHMIVLAGNCWGTNHQGLLPVNDTNVALGVHSYGNVTSGTLDLLVANRNKFKVPFVMTHLGSNELNEFSAKMVQSLKSNQVGWFWWTWKGLNTTSSPFQFGSCTAYNTLVEYWDNDCNGIHVDSAFRALVKVANNTLMSRTKPIATVAETLLGTKNETSQ